MEKKLLDLTIDRWFYVFPEFDLRLLLKAAGHVILPYREHTTEWSYHSVGIILKKPVHFGSQQEADENGMLMNTHTSCVAAEHIVAPVIPIPQEGDNTLVLQMSLCLEVAPEEVLTEEQIKGYYHRFAERLLGSWYIG